MAYLETLKSSQTWTCPKTGYYQVICVGGGGGGGGAGFYFTGALFLPNPIVYSTSLSPLLIGFKSATSGFISATTKGGTGSNGGSTSFGSLLTATGGQGGTGGGNTLGTAYPSANLNPSGGKSLMSAGGSGASVSSALNVIEIDNFFRINSATINSDAPICPTFPSNASTIGNVECLNFGGNNSLATPDGVLSAVSGGGGAGGNVETKTLFITKGTQIACTVGKGGSIGAKGSYTANTKATISLRVPNIPDVRPSSALVPNNFENAHSIYLLANVRGGGGGGGFTFEHSGGRGAEMQSEPLSSMLSRVKYHYCNAFKEIEKEPTGNGGKFTTGFGYGAGGSGGSINTRITLGLILPKDTTVENNITQDILYTVKTGCFGGRLMSLNNEGNTATSGGNGIQGVQLNSPDYCSITNASEGVSGAIVIREVS